ncbi:Uncharacterized protein TCM_005565 [Theobroma cacao]|uniref:Uncharacterized protein n=1 Tax=Theobroma cacao TaxID=3641 RepID=A0A061DV67_THECC|nr:Uncharacterized protein TCM_005565 [Theobroma cacao]
MAGGATWENKPCFKLRITAGFHYYAFYHPIKKNTTKTLFVLRLSFLCLHPQSHYWLLLYLANLFTSVISER